jgi:hypothetical protein
MEVERDLTCGYYPGILIRSTKNFSAGKRVLEDDG